MFIPLGDDNQGRSITPFVNYGLIGLNAYVWYLQLTLGESFTASYAGNMVHLAIFGDQVEDRLEHIRFLIFYLFAGVVAALTQVFADPTSILPSVGASARERTVLVDMHITEQDQISNQEGLPTKPLQSGS
jgi:membrane associated rhomboid family serine protease